jgi:NAD(P)-dependent dehydrogenase (short-subunit alcohol dehydrogenase family)
MKMDGQAAIVTGGASGLGAATVLALHERGAQVVVVDRPSERAERSVERMGNGVVFCPGSVCDEGPVHAAVEAASSLGALRVVVNCAGIGDPARTLGRQGPLTMERFRRVIDVNLLGTFNVIRLAASRMSETDPLEGERGVIINTASVAAFDGQIGQASYAASKAAIVGMTLPIARDLARDLIRVVTIAPGMFETPILAGLSDQARASIASQVLHPARLGQPSEYAALAVHIVENPMLNGETIRLDGAIRMGPV